MQAINIDGCFPKGGLIDEWLRFTEPFEFPQSYALLSLLSVASCAIEGRVLVNPGTQPSPYTNLYVVLYGPSGSRKGAAMEYARELLSRALPNAPILPSSGTMQGLIDELAEKTALLGRAPGMIYSEEFSDFVGGADYLERNSMILTQLYDCRGEWTERTRKHKKIIVKNPYVSILGASNPDWFENVNPRLLTGGFLRRLLLVVEFGPRQEAHAPKVNTVLFNKIAGEFQCRFDSLKGMLMPLTPEAQELDRRWYAETVGKLRHGVRSEREAHFVNTMQEHAMKLGAVMALLEGGGKDGLSPTPLACGQTLVMRLLPRIFDAYQSLAGTPQARLRSACVRVVRMFDGLTILDVVRAVKDDTGARAKDVAEALEDVLADGKLIRDGEGKIRCRT